MKQEQLDTNEYSKPSNSITTYISNLHKPIHGPQQRHVLVRSINGTQDDQHQNQGCTWNACRSNRCRGSCQNDGNQIPSIQNHSIDLGDENRSNGHEQCRPIHVNSCSNRQNKFWDPWVNTVIFGHASECYWQCRSTEDSIQKIELHLVLAM